MSTLDLDRLRKVRALMDRGATEGERAAARRKAELIAKAAGMSLAEALSKLDMPPPPPAGNIFDGFDDWMEGKEPGWKARQAAKRAAQDVREARRRHELLAIYGTEAQLFARTERELVLNAAIEPLATWDHWTGGDGAVHRYAVTLDGKRPLCGIWRETDITSAIREAVTGAYPWPETLVGALREVKEWDSLRFDREVFCSPHEWNHYAEVECRVTLLEHALECGQPAASWDDVQARFDWKRYEFERQWIDPTARDDPFLDRLEADFSHLRQTAPSVQSGHRTNAAKRESVRSILDTQPELSDREIARRAGVSPQTVNTWRRKRASPA